LSLVVREPERKRSGAKEAEGVGYLNWVKGNEDGDGYFKVVGRKT